MSVVHMRPGRWSEIITFGTTAVSLSVRPEAGTMFIHDTRWCEPCKQVCSQFHFAIFAGGDPSVLRQVEAPNLIP